MGNLVGYMLNGKPIIGLIGHSSKVLTPARKANCERMTIINTFLKPSLNFLRTGFRYITAGTDQNFYNAAVSYNKKHAVQGVYPNLSMDYTKELISMGSLLKADTTVISQHEDGIEFKWEVPSDLPRENRNDRAMLLIHFPDTNESRSVMSGARRQEGREVVYISENRPGRRMEAYIAFINEEATEISDSVYVSALNLPEQQSEQVPEPEQSIKPVIDQKKKTVVSAAVSQQKASPQKPIRPQQNFRGTSSPFNAGAQFCNYTFYALPS